MVILLRAGLGRADSLPLASPGLTKITPNITHIAMDGLSSQHRFRDGSFVPEVSLDRGSVYIDASVSQASPTRIRGGGYRQVRFRRRDYPRLKAQDFATKGAIPLLVGLYSAINVRFSNCEM